MIDDDAEKRQRLIDIQKAIDGFPALLRRKERAWRAQKKVLDAFAPAVRAIERAILAQKRVPAKRKKVAKR